MSHNTHNRTKKMEQVETMAIMHDNLRQVISPYSIDVDIDNQKCNITVPVSFAYDGASIPRVFWPLGSPYDSCYDTPSCVHDYLYRKQSDDQVMKDNKFVTISRRDADAIFRKLLEQNGNSKSKSYAIYCVVRTFGWMFYKKM